MPAGRVPRGPAFRAVRRRRPARRRAALRLAARAGRELHQARAPRPAPGGRFRTMASAASGTAPTTGCASIYSTCGRAPRPARIRATRCRPSSNCPIRRSSFPWRLADENSPERLLTGADADPESLVTMPDESFWIGDEIGPWLLHFSVDGELLAPPVELPDNVRSVDHPLVLAQRRRSRGCAHRAASRPWTWPATTRRW